MINHSSVHSDYIPHKRTWQYAVSVMLALASFQFLYAFFYTLDHNYILEISERFHFIFTIVFILILFVRRIFGIGVLMLSLIIIPSGGGVQPLNYLSDRISIPYYELWLFILWSTWLFDRLAKGDFTIPPALKSYKIFFLALLWMVCIGIVRGNPFIDIILDLREISYFLILSIIIPDYIKSKDDIYNLLTFFVTGVVTGVVLYYAWYLIMVANPSSILNEVMEKYETAGFRVEYRLVYSINTFATITTLALFSLVLSGYRLNGYLIALLFLVIGVIVLNQSRTSYVLTVIGFFLLIVRYKMLGLLSFRNFAKFVFLIVSVIFMGMIFYTTLSPDFIGALRDRASTLLSPEYLIANISSRVLPFSIAMEGVSWKDWLFGQGFGTLIYIPWFEETDFKIMNRFLDNLWLTIIVKGGLIGIVCVLSFFITFIRMANRCVQIKDSLFPIWMAMWCFGIINIVGIRAIFYDATNMVLFGFFAGILLGRLNINKRKAI